MIPFAGTRTLIRFILRRDRVSLPIWIVLVGLVPIGMAASYIQLYPTAQALKEFADLSMSTTATVGMLGFIYSPTVGGLTAWRSGLNSVFFIVPISILFIISHTRAEEASGRRELIGGSVVGRYAPLAAVLVEVLGANLLIAAIIAGGLIGLGLPIAGAITLGLSAASAGWVFAALAAVIAQLTESAGAARAITLAIFGLSWLVRAIGDLGESSGLEWLSWLSPLGWVRLTRAFADERWWVFALPVGLTAILAWAAFTLTARRDLGAGLVPARLGPASASPDLSSPLALAWRLHRGALLGWCAGAAAFGFMLGIVGVSIGKFVDAPQMQQWAIQMGARNAGDAFLFLVIYALGQVISVYAITTALRMRAEEVEGRADPILASPISRLNWALSHITVAVIGPSVMLLVLGLAIGLGYGLAASGAFASLGASIMFELPRLLARTMLTLPAVWVMGGIGIAMYGLRPQYAVPVTWGALALFLLLELGWELGQINQLVFNLSPFAHVHWAIQVTAAPLVGLTAIAAALTAGGMVGLSRRDIF